ncbi:hypothetical protein OsI_22988 [Oryza sativa Indica Group]|uniref:Uncharacterized protein n=1 Tax=Oryza sativa subsp. indica TaxID=39946 RepID=A2YCZ5_ORYSI|nr:hypothetical protein OsI_22988 [Oryza sativa Indica Group]
MMAQQRCERSKYELKETRKERGIGCGDRLRTVVGWHAVVDGATIAFVGGVLNGRGTTEPGHGGPAQVLASSGRHVMMRCVGRDGDDGLRRSENVAAEIAEEEKPSPLNALNRLRLSSSFAPPLLSSSRADGGRGEAARPSRRHAPMTN